MAKLSYETLNQMQRLPGGIMGLMYGGNQQRISDDERRLAMSAQFANQQMQAQQRALDMLGGLAQMERQEKFQEKQMLMAQEQHKSDQLFQLEVLNRQFAQQRAMWLMQNQNPKRRGGGGRTAAAGAGTNPLVTQALRKANGNPQAALQILNDGLTNPAFTPEQRRAVAQARVELIMGRTGQGGPAFVKPKPTPTPTPMPVTPVPIGNY